MRQIAKLGKLQVDWILHKIVVLNTFSEKYVSVLFKSFFSKAENTHLHAL